MDDRPRSTAFWVATVAGIVGAVGPLAVVVADRLIGSPIGQTEYSSLWDVLYLLGPIVWPTQFLMALTHGREQTSGNYHIFALSLVGNIVAFSVVGTLCWRVGHRLFQAIYRK